MHESLAFSLNALTVALAIVEVTLVFLLLAIIGVFYLLRDAIGGHGIGLGEARDDSPGPSEVAKPTGSPDAFMARGAGARDSTGYVWPAGSRLAIHDVAQARAASTPVFIAPSRRSILANCAVCSKIRGFFKNRG